MPSPVSHLLVSPVYWNHRMQTHLLV